MFDRIFSDENINVVLEFFLQNNELYVKRQNRKYSKIIKKWKVNLYNEMK